MAEKSNLKRLTRIDALVVLGVSVLVLLLVLPVFSGSRERSVRIVCKTNLSKIGKAMLIYTGDYEGAFPRAGGPTTAWGQTANWAAPDRYAAFGLNRADASGGTATVTASLYLLVKYLGVPPRLFVCKGDKGTTEFKLAELVGLPETFELIDAWDLGPFSDAYKHNSYAYHVPYDPCALTVDRDPNFAVAADRSPWIISPAAAAGDFSLFRPDIPPWNGSPEQAQAGSAITHQSDGQNVLFLDGRVSFQTRSFCGTRARVGPPKYWTEAHRDNIYTLSTERYTGDALGIPPVLSPHLGGNNKEDSVLVHDPGVVYGCRRHHGCSEIATTGGRLRRDLEMARYY